MEIRKRTIFQAIVFGDIPLGLIIYRPYGSGSRQLLRGADSP